MTTVRKPVRLRPLASAVRITPLLAAAMPMALPGAASAATIPVTDSSSQSGFCSIVDAVNSINHGFLWPGTNCSYTGDPFGINDTIDLSGFTSPTKISFASGQNNPNASSESALTLLVPAKISGSLLPNGVPAVTIERSPYANASFRLIDTTQDLFLNAVTLAGGKAIGGGGAVSNVTNPNAAQLLTLTDAALHNNRAVGPDGAPATVSNVTAFPQLTLTDVVLRDNEAGTYGGAVASEGILSVSRSEFSGNKAQGRGGAIFSSGGSNVFVDHTVVFNNSAGSGGGIAAGAIVLQHCQISGNSADHEGGGLRASGHVFATDSQIFNNTAAGAGGGIYSGGLSGPISLVNSTVSANSAHDGGGMLGSNVTLDASTVSGNSATNGGGGVSSNYLHATNSTISGNTAVVFGGGALVSSYNSPNSKVYFSTVTKNSVSGTTHGAGIFVAGANPNSVTLLSSGTLFFGNTGGTDIGFGYTSTMFVTGQHLLVGTSDAGTQLPGGTLSCNPQLGPLANNDSPTPIHALPNGSCAINTGDLATVPVDQRGYPRNFGNGADIGAFEYQPMEQVIKDDFEL